MKTILKTAAIGAVAVLTLGGDFADQAPFVYRFMPEAAAIVGRPLTPMSYAGVARRTAYRSAVVVTTAGAASASAAAANSAAASAAAASASAASASASAAKAAGAGALPVGTIVTSLPAGCVQTPINNVEYQKCGPTYFRAAFQGPNLIYVVQQP